MFGERLSSLRKKKKISQYELANRLGFSRGQIANYEQGKREPDYETLKIFADFFEVSTDYLLGHSDSPVEYTTSEKSFLDDLQLTDDELINKYKLIIDGKEASEEEIKNAIKYIKALRLMQSGEEN